MKLKYKIIIGIVVLLALLVSSYPLFMPQGVQDIPEMQGVGDVITRSAGPRIQKPSLLDNVDRLLNEMGFGTIAFNAPNSINIDDSPQIQLILSLAQTVEELKRSITEVGEKVGATIRVSDRMEARLSGYMFQITAITPEIQAVSKYQQTEWKWEIHPKEEGKHKLHLTLTALLDIDGYSTPRAIRTFDRVIEVNVTATQKLRFFFENNWQWLLGSPIVLGLMAWLVTKVRRIRRRRRPAGF